MSEIIEHDKGDNEQVVAVGRDESPISMKVYQDIYHQITGRTEKIKQKYTDNILLDFSEIQQLHFKIMQLCEVHNVIARNEIITVFHEKERKEQFTSFEKFQSYNSNATKPTTDVVLKYNFSIMLAGLKNPQEYIVTARLSSRVALLNELEENAPSFMRGRIFGLSARHTAEISVEYADYVIARSFLEAFDEWIDGCKSTPENKFLEFLQDNSHVIPNILPLIMSAVLIYFCLEAVPVFLTSTAAEDWGRFIVIFGGAFYFVVTLAATAGVIIARAIDSIQTLSYLKLNKGDDKLISTFSKRNKSTFWRFLGGCTLTVTLGVISSNLSDFLLK